VNAAMSLCGDVRPRNVAQPPVLRSSCEFHQNPSLELLKALNEEALAMDSPTTPRSRPASKSTDSEVQDAAIKAHFQYAKAHILATKLVFPEPEDKMDFDYRYQVFVNAGVPPEVLLLMITHAKVAHFDSYAQMFDTLLAVQQVSQEELPSRAIMVLLNTALEKTSDIMTKAEFKEFMEYGPGSDEIFAALVGFGSDGVHRSKLVHGLTFECPAGWMVDTPSSPVSPSSPNPGTKSPNSGTKRTMHEITGNPTKQLCSGNPRRGVTIGGKKYNLPRRADKDGISGNERAEADRDRVNASRNKSLKEQIKVITDIKREADAEKAAGLRPAEEPVLAFPRMS